MRATGLILTTVAVLLAGWSSGVADDAARPRHLICPVVALILGLYLARFGWRRTGDGTG